MLTRRQFLAGSALGAATLCVWPRLTFAATGSATRFLFVLLRGGLEQLVEQHHHPDGAAHAHHHPQPRREDLEPSRPGV